VARAQWSEEKQMYVPLGDATEPWYPQKTVEDPLLKALQRENASLAKRVAALEAHHMHIWKFASE
jgi:hypothetical protein